MADERDGPQDGGGRSDGDVTLAAYEVGADRYVRESPRPAAATLAFLDQFAELVGAGTVLELGSGPGWDADYVESRGPRVVRTDGAHSFVTRLRAAGHAARVLDIRSDDFGGPYDALLADAVLLHLTRAQFVEVLHRARAAVRKDGILAFTVKEGDGEAWSDAKLHAPRHFTYWREPAIRAALSATGWRTTNLTHRAGRTEPWLYVIAAAGAAVDPDQGQSADSG